jgi:hypothetical protein
LIPVIHTICGNVVMHFVGNPFETKAHISELNYLDGSHPESPYDIKNCPFCGEQMKLGVNLDWKIKT